MFLSIENDDYVLIPNQREVIVLKDDEEGKLGSKEVNYHLMTLRCWSNHLQVEISHNISDGAGLLPYVKSLLYYYLCEKEQKVLNPEGIRLISSVPTEEEIGSPYPDEEVAKAEKPLYEKKMLPFYQIPEKITEGRSWMLRLNEADMMRYSHENDGSPNAVTAVLLSKAIRAVHPEADEMITGGIAVNRKGVLGNYENYHMTANLATVDFSKKLDNRNTMNACTIARGQIILQTQPEVILYQTRQSLEGLDRIKMIPSLEMKKQMLLPIATQQRSTFCVSYTVNRTFGSMDPYIESVVIIAEPSVCGIICEILCLKNEFVLSFIQRMDTEEYFNAFLSLLDQEGIKYSLMGIDQLHLHGADYDALSREK